MKIQQYGILLIASALLAISASPVQANVCEQTSSLQQTLGDDYWDVELVIEKSNTPDNTLVGANQISSSLSVLALINNGDYTNGHGSRYVCKGTKSNIRVEEFVSTLETTGANRSTRGQLAGEHRLGFLEWTENKKKRTIHSTKLVVDLPDASKWKINADKSISSSQVNRRRNDLGFSRLQQIDTNLKETAEGIQLSQTLYFNGQRASWATWTLVK